MNPNYPPSTFAGDGFNYPPPNNGMIFLSNNSRVTFNYINSTGPPPVPPNYWPTGIPGNVYTYVRFSYSQMGYSQQQYGPQLNYYQLGTQTSYHFYYPRYPMIGNGIRNSYNGHGHFIAGSSTANGNYLVALPPPPAPLNEIGGNYESGADRVEALSTSSNERRNNVEQRSRQDSNATNTPKLHRPKPLKKKK